MESNRGRYLILTSGLQMNIQACAHVYMHIQKRNKSIQDKKVEYKKKKKTKSK